MSNFSVYLVSTLCFVFKQFDLCLSVIAFNFVFRWKMFLENEGNISCFEPIVCDVNYGSVDYDR